MKSSKVENEKRKTTRNPKFSTAEEIPPIPRSRVSPARNRNTSPVTKMTRRSPSRKSPSRKSPARKSPSRKSPGRKSPSRKSPARKSPSRVTKEVEDFPKSPSRRPAIKTISSVISDKKSSTSLKQEIPLPPLPTRTFRSEVIIEDFSTLKTYVTDSQNGQNAFNSIRSGLRERKARLPEDIGTAARRSSRLRESTEIFEKLLYKAQNTELPPSDFQYENEEDNYSEDDTPFKKDISVTRKLATPIREMSLPRSSPLEFGGILGVVSLMILAPLFVVLVNLLCTKSQCSLTSIPDLTPFKRLENWLTVRGLAIYFSFLLIQCTAILIPYFGKKAVLADSHQSWTCNGLFSLFVTLTTLVSMEYFRYPILQIINREYIPLMFMSMVFGLLLSFGVFLMARKVPETRRNKFGNTGKKIYDFWVGREVNTNIFGVFPVKVLLIRSALIAALLMNCIALYNGIKFKKQVLSNNNIPANSIDLELIETLKKMVLSASVSPTLLIFACQQIFFLLYSVITEIRSANSFDIQEEGTGYMMTMGYALYPFTTALIAKYILEHNIALSNVLLGVSVVTYLIGFYIYHTSNSQQHAFKLNPMHPKLCCLESTFGRRILISGLWGRVRHPNYLGEIIIVLSWSFAVLFALPILFVLSSVVVLVLKSSRDGSRSQKNYSVAWDRYRRRVPYNLLPKIY